MDQAQAQDIAKKYAQIVARAWADDTFKSRLLSDPTAVLREEGIDVPEGIEIRAVENTDKVAYLTLPPTPSEELSDEELESVAGGSTASTAGTGGSVATICGTASSASTAGTAGTV